MRVSVTEWPSWLGTSLQRELRGRESGIVVRMTAPTSHVVMGRIGAPWGIKGWVKVFSYTEPADNLMQYLRYEVEANGGLQPLEFAEIREQGGHFVALPKGVLTREDASRFTGLQLLVAKDRLPVLDEGVYWHQLEGLRVVTESGEDLGTVQYLMETGANDVLVVRGDEQSIDRLERLLPYVDGLVIRLLDLAAGRITVAWDSEWK